jgi:hypothetical protein
VFTMERDTGDKHFPIWLLGDSNPPRWQDSLATPLDPRHPSRHTIWTPVLDAIQDRVYREHRSRIDTRTIYIRNAVESPADKPTKTAINWPTVLNPKTTEVRQLLELHSPVFLLCFGQFSFEFARRALSQQPKHSCAQWTILALRDEFNRRIAAFDPNCINVLPLLHAIFALNFVASHNDFSEQTGGNYFTFAGNQIADTLEASKCTPNIANLD